MAVVTTNLGPVTAYGDAVEGGYTGTKEQWQSLMADYGTIGTQAQQDAQTASQAAQTATTKAGEASASATQAQQAAASVSTPDTTLTQSGKAADAKKVGDELTSVKENFNDMVNSAYVTDSASGGVAHFTDGADDVPMKSVKVNIEPVQSGSGDPSPDNIRPITGWDNVKVTRSGKNVFDNQFSNRTINGLTWALNSDGTITVNGTATAETQLHTQFVSGLDGEFYFSGCPSGGSASTYDVFIWDATNSRHAKQWNRTTDVVSELGEGNAQVYLEKGVTYRFCYRIRNGYTANNVVFSPMIRVATDSGDYEPYNGNTYTVGLSSAGTVYGGTLDVVSGVLTIDRASVTMDGSSDEGWYAMTTANIFRANAITPTPASGATAEDFSNHPIVSNCTNTSRYNYNLMKAAYPCVSLNDQGRLYLAISDDVTTIEQALAWLAENNLQLVYYLANPQTYQLTPQQVNSLLGVNNVWSDAGDVEVEYRADTKLYIDKKLAEVTS